MTLSDNWEDYWDRIEEGDAGSPIFYSRSSRDEIFDNLPDGRKGHLYLSGGSLCISDTKSLKWMPNEEEWVEL